MSSTLERLAATQHGVVSRRQLAAAGWSHAAIRHAVATRRLHRLHQGVYALGSPRLGVLGHAAAAVLAGGLGAGLGAASAAGAWELRPYPTGPWQVIVPTRGGRARPGIRMIRAPGLRSDEITTLAGVPITTPSRTLLDLAVTVRGLRLVRALDQAEVLRLFDLTALEAVIAAHPGHRGTGALRVALDHVAETPALTRTDLELLFLSIVERCGLPRPLVNVPVAGLTVDFLFPAARLVVEADSARWHLTRRRWEEDRERDRVLALAGHRVLRFTDRQLSRDPAGVGAAVVAVLAAGV